MAITPDCGARRFVLTGGALVAYAVGDIALCALVHANGSARSWQALTAFAALVAGFFSFAASLGCMALATFRDQHERTIQQRRPDYARIAELRYDTGRPIAEVIAAAERQAERDFARETEGYPVASGWELGEAMAALSETMRSASVSLTPVCNCPAGHPASEMLWSHGRSGFCGVCEKQRHYHSGPGPRMGCDCGEDEW
jgi:hypothetical protein